MKVIAIELDGQKAIFYALERNGQEIINITGDFKSLSISDVYNNSEIKEFQATTFSFFKNINPQKIAILKRNFKGQQSASPISFKLEGLIQCYEKDIVFIHPTTVIAFYRKNDFPLVADYKYQEKVSRLAYYLLEQ